MSVQYLISSDIKCYPTAFRSGYDEQSYLNTESNIARAKVLSSKLKCYFDDDDSFYYVYLNGYYFQINKSAMSSYISGTHCYVGITIANVQGTGDYTTNILVPVGASSPLILDNDTDGQFKGLGIDTSSYSSFNYYVDLKDDSFRHRILASEIRNVGNESFGINEKFVTDEIIVDGIDIKEDSGISLSTASELIKVNSNKSLNVGASLTTSGKDVTINNTNNTSSTIEVTSSNGYVGVKPTSNGDYVTIATKNGDSVTYNTKGVKEDNTNSTIVARNASGEVKVKDIYVSNQAISGNNNKVICVNSQGKLVATEVSTSDPTASGTSISFISTITQTSNGKISPTKATIPTATTSQLGIVKSTVTGTTAGRDYYVEVSNDGTMKVNVPWINYTGTGNISVSNGVISTTGLGSLALKSTIGTDDITNSSVTTAKLADGAVTNAKILDGTIANDKLAGSIANNKLANSSIKIGSTAVSLGGTLTNISTTGSITASSFNAQSDVRLKENIRNYSSDKSILELPIYKYDFINGEKNQIGCLAQDLQKICPEIVKENERGYLAIQESKIVYLLIKEVKELRDKIDSLTK